MDDTPDEAKKHEFNAALDRIARSEAVSLNNPVHIRPLVNGGVEVALYWTAGVDLIGGLALPSDSSPFDQVQRVAKSIADRGKIYCSPNISSAASRAKIASWIVTWDVSSPFAQEQLAELFEEVEKDGWDTRGQSGD